MTSRHNKLSKFIADTLTIWLLLIVVSAIIYMIFFGITGAPVHWDALVLIGIVLLVIAKLLAYAMSRDAYNR